MGNYLERDYREFKWVNDHYAYEREFRWPGPPKREPPDEMLRGFLEVILPEFARHIEALEAHLEGDAVKKGRAFVRPEERPLVGKEALTVAAEPIRLLEKRVASLEHALAKPHEARPVA